MDAFLAQLRHVFEPLVSQRIEGTVSLRFWAQAIGPAKSWFGSMVGRIGAMAAATG